MNVMPALQKFLGGLKAEVKTLRRLIYQRAYDAATLGRSTSLLDEFHKFYYDSAILKEGRGTTYWLGVPALKLPQDLWIYQEILHELKPDVIIETGTAAGGSALYLASLCDLLNQGRVITIDIEFRADRPKHPRITYLTGSSVSPSIVEQVKQAIKPGEIVMAILDSDHTEKHVLEELRVYAPLVTPGQYMIVEDSNVNGHPVDSAHGPGPMEAIDVFLKENSQFGIDKAREKLLLTFNPRGYLRKTR